jgi:hypothetical protein
VLVKRFTAGNTAKTSIIFLIFNHRKETSMKKIVLLSLFLLCVATGFAQESYFVTVVKGSVSKADGSAIKPGSKLSTADKVSMGTKESLLILLHPSKGRIVVSPQAATPSKDNKFVLVVKDFLELNQQQVRLSSRTLEEAPLSLEDYFKTDADINNSVLIIDTLTVKLPRAYVNADNKENFFFLQLSGAKPVNHKLLCRNNMLYITKEDISFTNGLYKKTDGQLNLGYIENYSTNKKVKFITPIEPAFIGREEVSTVTKTIKKTLKGKPENEILAEICTQLYYQYGKPDELSVKAIYNTVK